MIEDGAQTEITSFLIANDSQVIGVPILIEKKCIQLYDRAEVPAESTEPGDSLHKINGVADPFFNRLQLSFCLCHTYALIGSMQPFQWDQVSACCRKLRLEHPGITFNSVWTSIGS